MDTGPEAFPQLCHPNEFMLLVLSRVFLLCFCTLNAFNQASTSLTIAVIVSLSVAVTVVVIVVQSYWLESVSSSSFCIFSLSRRASTSVIIISSNNSGVISSSTRSGSGSRGSSSRPPTAVTCCIGGGSDVCPEWRVVEPWQSFRVSLKIDALARAAVALCCAPLPCVAASDTS